VQWNNAALQALRDTKPGPPMVVRALAFVHTCIYDAWTAYDPIAVPTRASGVLKVCSHRSNANRTKAISYAAYRALVDLFPQPAEVAQFNALMAGEFEVRGEPAARGRTANTRRNQSIMAG
jgi:hypothetical protein